MNLFNTFLYQRVLQPRFKSEAYVALYHDLDALGGIITFFELGFYSGNIYSAVSSAHKYNRVEKSKFLKYLKRHGKINISSVRQNENESLVLLCKLSF